MHLWHQVVVNADPAFRVEFINVGLEARKADLITILEISIVFGMFLDSIIGQVNERIVNVLKVDSEFS